MTLQSRWEKADENFRMQIDRLMVEMRTSDKRRVADESGIGRATFYNRYNRPGTLVKQEERMIGSLFMRYGLRYDATLGEGAVT